MIRPLRPLLPALLLLALFAAAADAAATRRAEGDAVVLENAHLKARINPARGGRLESLVMKASGDELVAGDCVVEEVVPIAGKRLPLADTAMALAPEQPAAGAAACVLSCTLPDGELAKPRPGLGEGVFYYPQPVFHQFRLEKEYRLADGAARLEVTYRITNTGKEPAALCLAFADALADRKARGDVLVSGVTGAMAFPDKFKRDDYDRFNQFTARQPSYGFTELSGDWLGTLSDRGVGALRHFDVRCLTSLGLRVDGSRRTEALSTDVTVEPGKTWTFATSIMPLAGQAAVQLATPTFVGGIAFDPPAKAGGDRDDMDLARTLATQKGAAPAQGPTGAIYPSKYKIGGRCALLSAVDETVGLTLMLRRGADGPPQRLGATRIALKAGVAREAPFGFTPPEGGTWFVSIGVSHDAAGTTAIERAVVVDAPSGGETRARILSERIGTPHPDTLRSFPPPVTYRPAMDLVSPHIPFARPYARGPVKALFLYPYYGGRDVVELAERLDLDYRFAGIGVEAAARDKKLGEGKASGDEVERARALMTEPVDVVVSAFRWEYWPWDVRAEILRRVREEGMGLVLLNAGEREDLAKIEKTARRGGNPFPGPAGEVTTVGKGRIVFIGKGSRAIDVPQVGRDFDSIEPFVRALVWAAQKEPPVGVSSDLPATLENTRSAPAATVRLLNHTDKPFNGTLTVTFRQVRPFARGDQNMLPLQWWEDRGRVTQSIKALAPHQQIEAGVAVPTLAAGDYRVTAELRDDAGRAAGWLAHRLRVTSAYQVAEVWLSKAGQKPVLCDGRWPRIGYFPSETMQARVVVRAPVGVQKLTACRLRLSDPHGRIIYDAAAPVAEDKPDQGEARFAVPLTFALHRALIADFSAGPDGEAMLAETSVFVPMRCHPDRRPLFRFTQMDNEGLVPFEQLEFAQYTNGSGFNRRFEMCAMRNFEFHAAAMDVLPGEIKWEGETRVPCLNDPQWRAAMVAEYEKLLPFYDLWGKVELPITHEAAGPYHPRGLNPCHCDSCQAAFRTYLQRIYPDLAAVNRAWHANFADWDAITIPELNVKSCPAPDRWAPAIDVLRWTADQSADWGDVIAGMVKKLTTDGVTGNWALNKMGIDEGMDFERMARWGNYAILYRDYNEWVSLAGPGATRMWRGYGRDYNPSQQMVEPWEILLHDESGSGDFTCNWYPMCRPDGTLFPGPEQYYTEYRNVRRGPAKLLLGRYQRAPVAIHWSAPSFFVYETERWRYNSEHGKSTLGQRGGAMDWPRRIAHLYQGTGGLGLDPFYVGAMALADGKMGFFGTPKIMFLPYSIVMNAAEAKTIERFVADGGVLVGGVNPATLDRHGVPFAAPLLDNVFGVRRDGYQTRVLGAAADDPNTRISLDIDIRDAPKSFNNLVVAPGNITAVSAKPLAHYTVNGKHAPALLVNTFGKGKAVLLNFEPLHLNEYTGAPMTDEAAAAYKAIIRYLITEVAGVKPWATTFVNGEATNDEPARFGDGNNTYLGLTAAWGMPPEYYAGRKVEVALPKKCHVYEMIAGCYLGETDRPQASFDVHHLCNIFSLLPYRVTGLDATPASATANPGDDVAFDVVVKTDGAAPGRHVVRVEVFNPGGEKVTLYGWNLELPAGKGRGHVYLALNDAPGQWRITLRDIATGITAKQTFTVTAGH